MGLRLVLTTVPRKSARGFARRLVQRRLAACANVLPVESEYWWESSLREEEESLIVFKTTERKANELRTVLARDHPYETPEVLEIRPARVNRKYLSWVTRSVAG